MIKAHKPKMLCEDQVAIFSTYSFRNPVMQFLVKGTWQIQNLKNEVIFGLHQAKLASEIYFCKTSEAKNLEGFKTRWDISADYICKTSAIL